MLGLKWGIIPQNLPFLLQATVTTLQISVVSVLFGLILGWLFGLFSVSHSRPLRWITWAYVQFFRGTPLLVQILLVYFGLAGVGLNLSAFVAGVVALSLNAGAYSAEIVRAALESIDRGQTDAADSIGLSRVQTLLFILVPQAVRRAVPGITNEMIALVKASSLLAVIGTLELTHAGQVIIARTFTPFEIYITVAAIYLVLVAVLSRASSYLEKRVFVNY
jgi:arginine/lysine/histidine/glutamine transport system substrate-binding/permease protein